MKDYQDVIDRLNDINGVQSVKDGSTGRIKAIDFKLFELSRPTNASNLVFGRYGMSYKNGLIRLPRVSKDNFTEKELENKILRAIPEPDHPCVNIRFEPEVKLNKNYYYPHIEIHGDINQSLRIIESLVNEYNPPVNE